MSEIVNTLRVRKEKIYKVLGLIFGILLWFVITWGCWHGLTNPVEDVRNITRIYMGYAGAFTVFLLISSAAYRAAAFGNMILLGPTQFPELYEMVVAGSHNIGLSKPPTTFLYNSNGLVNAFARRLLGGRYVFLTSALVEASDDEQVRFVIGHELGHHAAGHLNPLLNIVMFPAHFIPFLMSAYSRAREYSCDKIGVYLSKDLKASQGALQMLGCGCRRLNHAMNCEDFMAQEAKVPPIFGFICEIFRSHPRLTRRVAAIKEQQSRDFAN